MKSSVARQIKRNETAVVAAIIAVVFVAAMGVVAWMLRSSMMAPPYEALATDDLKRVFATAYLRHREDDGKPYLKIEIHNGTHWWIKKVEFEFEGVRYTLTDPLVFQPMHYGALRCPLAREPAEAPKREYDINILKAVGYPPAEPQLDRQIKKMAGRADRSS